MGNETKLRDLLHSTGLWTIGFTIAAFLGIIFLGRPFLHVLGLLFGLMGGAGLEGTGL